MENLIEVSPQIKTKGFHKCLGSLEIRKTGISFIIGSDSIYNDYNIIRRKEI